MNRGNGLASVALILSVLALLVAGWGYLSRPRAAPTAAAPARVALSMIVATFSGQGVFAHRWYPTMMVVREGDTVDLAVANPDQVTHQLEIVTPNGTAIRSKALAPGASDRLTLVADQVGVYEYHCALPYDPARGQCTPDHEQMRGYLIVTGR
ncbi:MAG: cupredoxin domain-containing protein [Armatimonadota bacterium]|nr:cupredoxin domain-containing protein [Armatimonadota bacterium]MDR7486305.1 cupredoxin domain-containing protein [Armatimonadota bacterium]MDR7532280.1 cupredoxin domain-containing protein [Armatimonadota bacterium]MDR7537247.1 cupredoxin domain-containing protein [Armatimonadota bacterium]